MRDLKTIIMDYCSASGQRINAAKSTLTFNQGVDVNVYSTIEEDLCIVRSTDP